MRKFRFPLERLLQVRAQRARAAQADLHAKIARHLEAERRVAAVEAEMQGVIAEIRERLLRAPTATEVIVADTVLRGMHAVLICEHAGCEAAANTVAQARSVVERRHRDVEVVERLKERAVRRHRVEVTREHDKAMDEMVQEQARRGLA